MSNTCKGCAIDYQIGGMQGGNLTITDHTSEGNTQKVVKADSASNIQINGGMFVGGQGVGLEFLRCENIAVNDPTFLDWQGPSAVEFSNFGATRSVFGTISAMIEGCTEVPIKITFSDEFFVDGGNIKTDCTYDVEIGVATSQAASDGTVFGSNTFRRGVLDGGTNTAAL